MIKNLLPLVLVLFKPDGDKFLNEIALYQKDSYFKQKVYAELNFKSFSQLKEASEIVSPENYDLHLLNAAIFFATNKVREEKRLRPLAFSSTLRDAAVIHSQQMIEKRFFDHMNNKTRKLRSPDDRLKLFGVNATAMGENIDLNYITMPSKTTYLQLAAKIVDAWMHSTPHRKTMLSKSYSHLGCAAAFEEKDKSGVRYVKATQDYSLQK